MCGIAGIAGHSGDHIAQLGRMTDAIAHRGPDNGASWHDEKVALGHRRLSILDTSSRGHQPMLDKDGRFVLIHNGEVYNYASIRSQIDYPFQTGTDTEMILAAWEKWGPKCLEKFAGMFAFAIWDRQEKTLFIVRDRLGIKPIYYHQNGGQLIFGSEIRSLLASGLVPKQLNRDALPGYLCYQTSYGESTLAKDIQLLPPGHYLRWKDGQMEVKRWWNIWENASTAAKEMDAKAIQQQVKALLDQSIQRRMVSDVPIGAFLSGGIDSSAIVALMAQASEQPVDTFSVVFEEKEYDESQWSELIAKQYNTRHHPILLKPSDFLEALPAALRAMDHPSGDGINSYVVSGLTRQQGVKVALSGLGGDELFGGYPVFTQLPAIMQKKLLKLPYGLRKLAAAAIGMSGSRRSEKIGSLLRIPEPSLEAVYSIFRTIYNWQELKTQLNLPQGFPHPLASTFEAQAQARKKLPLLSQIGGLEIQTYTGNVLLRDTDQMSMAHALEVRVPFFDHDLVEFVMGIPDSVKHPHYPKQLLVESLGPLLPHDLVHRKKMGFVFPWEHWLRNDLKDFCGSRIQSLDEKGIMGKPGTMTAIWNQYLQQKGPWLWTHIWLPVVLEEWMSLNKMEA